MVGNGTVSIEACEEIFESALDLVGTGGHGVTGAGGTPLTMEVTRVHPLPVF